MKQYRMGIHEFDLYSVEYEMDGAILVADFGAGPEHTVGPFRSPFTAAGAVHYQQEKLFQENQLTEKYWAEYQLKLPKRKRARCVTARNGYVVWEFDDGNGPTWVLYGPDGPVSDFNPDSAASAEALFEALMLDIEEEQAIAEEQGVEEVQPASSSTRKM